MQETACQCRRFKRLGFHPWVRKIPLEKEMATHSSLSCLEYPMNGGAWRATVMESQE